jgi:hypothetical protein
VAIPVIRRSRVDQCRGIRRSLASVASSTQGRSRRRPKELRIRPAEGLRASLEARRLGGMRYSSLRPFFQPLCNERALVPRRRDTSNRLRRLRSLVHRREQSRSAKAGPFFTRALPRRRRRPSSAELRERD